MRYISYLVIGIFFGIIMYKSEAASWFRIYEMFQFGSFHMYGIIGSALVIGVVGYLIGGIIFGLGWALAGACPGPMYVLAGAGYYSILVVIGGALLGTFVYGVVKDKLPH